jgi:hypothetical protein
VARGLAHADVGLRPHSAQFDSLFHTRLPSQYLPQFTDKTWLLGAGSLVVQPLGGTSSLALFSPAQNAFGRKSVAWVAALGAKMGTVL